jgi:hypothetical protein
VLHLVNCIASKLLFLGSAFNDFSSELLHHLNCWKTIFCVLAMYFLGTTFSETKVITASK